MNSIKSTLVFQSLDTEVSERQRQQVVFARAVPSPVPHSPRVESGTHCQQLGGLGQFIVLHGSPTGALSSSVVSPRGYSLPICKITFYCRRLSKLGRNVAFYMFSVICSCFVYICDVSCVRTSAGVRDSDVVIKS